MKTLWPSSMRGAENRAFPNTATITTAKAASQAIGRGVTVPAKIATDAIRRSA